LVEIAFHLSVKKISKLSFSLPTKDKIKENLVNFKIFMISLNHNIRKNIVPAFILVYLFWKNPKKKQMNIMQFSKK